MKTVVWGLLDKESEDTSNFRPFIQRVFTELELLTDTEKILFTIDTGKLSLTSKKEVINLVKELLCLLKNNKVSILTSQNDEMINARAFNEEVEFFSVTEDGFYQIEHRRKVEKLSDYKAQKPFFLSKLYLPRSLVEAQFIVPVNVFDISAIFGIKGVVSSFFWFLPNYTKSEVLIKNNNVDRAIALLEVFSEINKKIAFAVNLLINEKRVAVIATDAVSVDAFTSALGGIKALSIPTTKIANKEKIGMGDIMRLRIAGEKFAKPVLFLERRKVSELVTIDQEVCDLCMKCTDSCPLSAISAKEGFLSINSNLCNKCAYCIEICPLNAIN